MTTAARRQIAARLGTLEQRIREADAARARAHDAARTTGRPPDPRAVVARTDLHRWAERFLKHYLTDPSPPCHAELLRDLAAGTARRHMREVVVGSRGTAKSFVVSLAYVLACAVTGAEPYTLLISETAEQANLLLAAVKTELEDNADLAAAYPDACGPGPVWRENAVVLRNGSRIEAVGSGKRLRGRRKRQNRPTLVVLDDAEGDAHGYSPELRTKSSAWFHKTVMKIGDASTNFVVVANAIQRDTLAMKLCTKPSWHGRVWQSIVRYPDRMDLWAAWEALYLTPTDGERARAAAYFAQHRAEMTAGAVLLWPGRESLIELMQARAEDRTSFESEKQCNPVNPEMCEWGDAYFDGLVWFTKWPKRTTVRTVAVDPSKGKDDRRSDYSAIVELARDHEGVLWVRADLKRRDAAAITVDAVRAAGRFDPDRAVCEANQFQSLFLEDFADEAAQQGVPVAFVGIENTVKKIVRIRRLTPYLSRRQFRFFDDAGTRLLVEQLRDFPVGSHDDGPDALEMAIRAAVDAYNVGRDNDGPNSRVGFDVE